MPTTRNRTELNQRTDSAVRNDGTWKSVGQALVRSMRGPVGKATAMFILLSTSVSNGQDVTTPTYCVIPIHGTIGADVAARPLEASMKMASMDKHTVIILEIDSPGGMVCECMKMVDVLAKYRDRKTIAWVKSALSAAAILALTCDEIYMEPTATIGAATPYLLANSGLLQQVSEKSLSMLREEARMAAQLGGHNVLLAEAMVDPSLQIWLRRDAADSIEIIESSTPVENTRVIVKQGDSLTLTASEAGDVGLSKKTISGIVDLLNSAAGLRNAKESGRQARQQMKTYARAFLSAKEKAEGFDAMISKKLANFRKQRFSSRSSFRTAYDALVRSFEKDLKEMRTVAASYPALEYLCEEIDAALELLRERSTSP